jgi:hypothetical protein
VTIRTYIRRRLILGFGSAFIGFLFAVVVMLFKEGETSPFFALAFIPFIAAIFFINFGVRCPRCEGNLAMTPAAYPNLSKKHRFNFCPYCGVSVDEDI